MGSGALHPLIQEPLAAFFWSPDGTRILYAKRNPDRAHWTWVVVDVHSRTSFPVVNFIPSRPQILVFQYFDQYALSHRLWSPDGQFFTFSGHTDPNPNPGPDIRSPSVYIVPVTKDATPQRLSDGHIAFWSPQ